MLNVQSTIRKLRSDKRWFDEMIASLEEFQNSKPFQAVTLLHLHLAKNGRFERGRISPQSRRQLVQWLGGSRRHGRSRTGARRGSLRGCV